jgi:molybdopterin synthase sulfur carrier subunit
MSAPTPPMAGPDRLTVPIRLPQPLRELAGGRSEVVVEAGTVGEALVTLLETHPGLRRHLRDEAGALRDHVNVFVNAEDVRYLRGESTRVAEGDVLTVVASIAGG